MEKWRIVAEFPDYAVSSNGRIKRIIPDKQGKNMSRILKGWIPYTGYPQVRLYKNGKSKSVLVHRIVCIAFHGAAPNAKLQASHKDGSRTNNHKGNIRWKTPSENNMEKHRHGTMLTGEKHPSRYRPESVLRGSRHGNAKLNEQDVVKIRADKRTCAAIAIEYGVDLSLISKVRRRAYWKHVL